MKTEKIICHPQTFGKVDKKYLDFKNCIKDNISGNYKDEIEIKIKLYLEKVRTERSDLDQKNESHRTLKGAVCDRLSFLGCSELKTRFATTTH